MSSVCIMKNDPEISSVIWPSFKPTLEEKHGYTGNMGETGERNALTLIESGTPFGDVKYVVWHQDALHQMMGIDFTIFNGRYFFVDVKSGASSLYYDKTVGGRYGWYITVRPSVLNKTNKTDILMHLGPKGDVYVWYPKKKMKDYIDSHYDGNDSVRLYTRDWPEFIKSNLR